MDGDKNDCGYSFLSMDPNWDTLQRGGPWTPADLTTLEFMRSDFKVIAGITDMILRFVAYNLKKKKHLHGFTFFSELKTPWYMGISTDSLAFSTNKQVM